MLSITWLFILFIQLRHCGGPCGRRKVVRTYIGSSYSYVAYSYVRPLTSVTYLLHLLFQVCAGGSAEGLKLQVCNLP